jgi:hypothetical protein
MSNKSSIPDILISINKFVKQMVCCDCEIISYEKQILKIGGGLSLSYQHSFFITFENVFYINCLETWSVNTTNDFIFLISGEDAKAINMEFRIEMGYYLFKICTETSCLYISAKNIDFISRD